MKVNTLRMTAAAPSYGMLRAFKAEVEKRYPVAMNGLAPLYPHVHIKIFDRMLFSSKRLVPSGGMRPHFPCFVPQAHLPPS